MSRTKPQVNFTLPTIAIAPLKKEQSAGISMSATLTSAIFWYFNILTAQQREVARRLSADWVESGEVPDLGAAMQAAFRTDKPPQSRMGKKGAGE
jgi:hypothetical protein